jgi:hypothetical protein
MLIGNDHQEKQENNMGPKDHTGTKSRLQRKSLGIHLNKVQATLCLAASVAISVGLILWGVEAFI